MCFLDSIINPEPYIMNTSLEEEVKTLRNWLDQTESSLILLRMAIRLEIKCYSEATKAKDLEEMTRSAFNYLKMTFQTRALFRAWKPLNQEYKQALVRFQNSLAKAC